MSQFVEAVFNYEKQHNDENEILLHIIEGEMRQINEFKFLNDDFVPTFLPFSNEPYLHHVPHLKEILERAVNLHRSLTTKLECAKSSGEPYFVGKIFLDLHPLFEHLIFDFIEIHSYLVQGISLKEDQIPDKEPEYFSKVKEHLFSIIDRVNRYPILLKEMERYLEVEHLDKSSLLAAIHCYTVLAERSASLRKSKQCIIDVLSSNFSNWIGAPISSMCDPVICLRITIISLQPPTLFNLEQHKHSVLALFPEALLLLSLTTTPDLLDLLLRAPQQKASFTVVDNDILLAISEADSQHFESQSLKLQFQLSDADFMEQFMLLLGLNKSSHANRFSCLTNNTFDAMDFENKNLAKLPRDDSTIQLHSSTLPNDEPSKSVITQTDFMQKPVAKKRFSYQNPSYHHPD
ncbi:Rho guanine nucleotide exchange factor 6, partial [Cichlidogyrus casuarinus]